MLTTTRDLLVSQSKTAAADKVAVVDGAQRVTYAELLQLAQGYATLLKETGIRKGDRVAIFLRRSVQAVTALFATWFLGAIPVVIYDLVRERQVHYIVRHTEASCLVTDTRQLLSVPNFSSVLRRVINIDQVEPSRDPWPAERAIGSDLALIIHTSGSSGSPKGVMLSHDNLLSGARIVSDYLRLTDRDVILSLLPFSFDYGLNQLLTAFLVGATLVIQRSPFAPDICKTLHTERITGLAGVPTLWLQLTGRQSPFLTMTLPHLRYITNSGGRLPEHVVRAIRAAHPHVQVYLMYGLTEAFRSTYLAPDEVDRRPSSIGKAIPDTEVLVVSQEGRLCRPGEVGELVHRGPTVALGYWRDPESTARVFRPHPLQEVRNGSTERVVFSGDRVKMDSEGYLYFVGRRDQLIKSRGFRVSPEDIEACVASSNLVSNVVSFAVPRDEADNDIVIAVIPSEPSSFREEALHEFCKNELPEYMWPRAIWRLNEFPLTTSGKPDRCKIREMYVERCDRSRSVAGATRAA